MSTSKYIARDLAEALRFHQSGQLPQAEALYRRVLSQDPRNADALHLLGVLAHQVGQHDAAIELIRAAVAQRPSAPEFHNNLGEVLRSLGRLDEADACFSKALQLNETYLDARYNSALVAYAQRRFAQAEDALCRILRLAPDHPGALSTLGAVLGAAGKFNQAIPLLESLVQRQPNLADVWVNLSISLLAADQPDRARAAAARATEAAPHNPAAWFNLGAAQQKLNCTADAIDAYSRCLELAPDHAEALNNVGVCYSRLRRMDEALTAFERALQLNPDNIDTLNNAGVALISMNRPARAEPFCRRALELRPDFAEAAANLALSLYQQGLCEQSLAACDAALALRRSAEALNTRAMALQALARLDEAETAMRQAIALDPDAAGFGSNLLLHLHFAPHDPDAVFHEHLDWAARHADPLLASAAPHLNSRDPDRRLRIAYTSCDFRRHSVNYFVEPILANHDPSQFEVFCYADEIWSDDETQRIRSLVPNWRDIRRLDDAQLAEQIRADGIDILVDLVGHTASNRLLALARKPAPIQVTYLGYADTTGMRAMDYRLTDALADPPGASDRRNSEKLVRLPSTAWCYAPPRESLPLERPPRPERHIVLGCFNVLSKINDDVIALWSEVLRAIPSATLLIKNRASRDPVALHERFARHGIAPDRLEFLGRVDSYTDHLRLYHRLDLMLDPFPYHGTTTTCESLWMGVPVLTLAGQVHAARVGVSLLTSVGLPELIAESREAYVEKAASLAADLPCLAEIQASLRARMTASPLTDGRTFAANLESAYRRMWRTWCQK